MMRRAAAWACVAAVIGCMAAGGHAADKAPARAAPLRAEPDNAIHGFTNTPLVPGTTWHVHDPNRPQPKYVQPKYDGKPVPAPAGATVLFDGRNLDKWRNKGWKLVDGAMQVSKGGQVSVDEFGDMHLHVEWLVPDGLKGGCQKQGNSGVYMMARYEIQVLNCYNNRTYADGMTAAMYGQYPPRVNACRKPGQWQAYDIHFKAPVWKDGKLVSAAYVTVYFNGVLVHDNRRFMGPSGWRRVAKYSKPHPPKGPISLQAHGSPVKYRNIWVAPLTKKLGPDAPKSGR